MPEQSLPPKDSPVAGVRTIHAALREEMEKLRVAHPQRAVSLTPEAPSEGRAQTFRLALGDRWIQVELEWFERAKYDPAMGGPPYRGIGAVGTSWGQRWKVILWDSLKKEFQWGYYEGTTVKPITPDFLRSLVAALPGP